MKKMKMFALFIMLMLCTTLLSACSDDITPKLDEPYCIVFSENNFSKVCSAYETQTKAKENPTIIYTDALSEGHEIKTQIYTREDSDIYYSTRQCFAYGTYFLYRKGYKFSAYAYIEIKPLSEKPSDSCTDEQQENDVENAEQEQEEISSSEVSDLDETENNNDPEDTEQQEGVETEEPSIETSELVDSENSDSSESEEIDFSPIYDKFDGIVDKETIQKDLNDFAKGEWDGKVRTENNVGRFVSTLKREYVVIYDNTKMIRANMDYDGELKQDVSSQRTIVANGTSIEEWQYFQLVNSWQIENNQEIVEIYACGEEDWCGWVVTRDTNGKEYTYDLYSDGTIEKY